MLQADDAAACLPASCATRGAVYLLRRLAAVTCASPRIAMLDAAMRLIC